MRQLVKDSFNLEVVNADDFDDLMRKYNANILPLSRIYNNQSEPVWGVSGMHDREVVRAELKKQFLKYKKINKFI